MKPDEPHCLLDNMNKAFHTKDDEPSPCLRVYWCKLMCSDCGWNSEVFEQRKKILREYGPHSLERR